MCIRPEETAAPNTALKLEGGGGFRCSAGGSRESTLDANEMD